jgi:membrane protease YdiL (CAAX protease family)
LSAGVTEEVMVSVVVIALSAARRPVWEMYALSCLMRVSYHTYYQTVGLSVIVMGLISVWLYRRSRRLTPIIVGHIVYDAMASIGLIGRVWVVAAALAVCFVTSLADKYWAKPPAQESAVAAREVVPAEKEPT